MKLRLVLVLVRFSFSLQFACFPKM